jgi:hypothetical protein
MSRANRKPGEGNRTRVALGKVVGALWPNDPDGNAWGDPKTGFPPALKKAGYKIVDPGRVPDGNDDFSSQISQFQSAGVQIVTGVPIPPDFTTFWTQALQQGFHPIVDAIVQWSAFMIFIVVIGGIGTIEGPIVGTVVFFTLQKQLANYGVWYLIILGAVAVLAAVWIRDGIWGVVGRRFDLRLFPVQRRVRIPADAAARRVPEAAP